MTANDFDSAMMANALRMAARGLGQHGTQSERRRGHRG